MLNRVSKILCLLSLFIVFSCRVNPNVSAEKPSNGSSDDSNNSSLTISIDGPSTGNVGSCQGPFQIQLKDQNNSVQSAPLNFSATVKGGTSISYYSDSGCTNQNANIQFQTGETVKNVYIRSTKAQNLFLILESSQYSSQNRAFEFLPLNPTKFVLTGSSVLPAGTCSTKYTVALFDQYDNETIAQNNLLITVTDLSSSQIYDDNTCAQSLSNLNIPTGQKQVDFYLKDNVKENFIINLSAAGFPNVNQGIIVTSGPAYKLVLDVQNSSIAGECTSAGTIKTLDILDNQTPVSSNTTVTLSDSGGKGQFYLTNDCSGVPVSSILISSGNSQSSIYYKNQKAENSILSAVSTGLVTGTLSHLTVAADPKIININADLLKAGDNIGTPGGSMPYTTIAGQCYGPIKVAIQDVYFNLSTVSATVNINLTSIYKTGNGGFYTDSSCASSKVTSVSFASGENVKDLYYKGTRIDDTNILAETSAPLPGDFFNLTATTNAKVIADVVHHLYLTGPQFFYKDECTPVFTVLAQDQFDNLATLNSSLNIDLSSAVGSGSAYSDEECTQSIATQQITVPAGSNKALFYIKVPNYETINQTVTSLGLNPGTNIIAIKPSLTAVEKWAGYYVSQGFGYYTTGAVTFGLTKQPIHTGYDMPDPLRSRFYGPGQMVHHGGYLYYIDKASCAIFKIDPATWTRTVYAGEIATCSYTDGSDRTTARISSSASAYFHINSTGSNIYFSDAHSIRSIDLATGGISTLAGQYNVAAFADAVGATARFNNPGAITELNGYLYISDLTNNRIRRLDLGSLAVTSVVNTGISAPRGITSDGTDIYFLERYALWKYNVSLNSATVFAGNSITGGTNDDLTGTNARFGNTVLSPYYPLNVSINPALTDLYVADTFNSTIRKVNIATTAVTTVAGLARNPGNTDGSTATAKIAAPFGVAFNSTGDKMYVLDGYGTVDPVIYSAANNYSMSNQNLKVVDMVTSQVSRVMGSPEEYRRQTGTTGARNSTAIAVNQNTSIATDGQYMYYTSGNNVLYSVLVGAPTNTIQNAGAASLVGATFNINSQQFSNGYYYYVNGTYVYRRAVVNGIFSGSVENLAGTATAGITDGLGVEARLASARWGAVDPSVQSFYFYDVYLGNCYLRKLDLSTNNVITIKNLGGSTTALNYAYCASTDSAYRPVRVGNFMYAQYNKLYKMNLADGTVTVLSSNSGNGFQDGIAATNRLIEAANSFCTDDKYLYTIDSSVLRKVSLSTGEIVSLGGNPNRYNQEDGLLSDVHFYPNATHGTRGTCTFNSEGLFIIDAYSAIRRVY